MIDLIIIPEIVSNIVSFTILGFLLGLTSFMLGLGFSSGVSILSIITKS